MTRRVAQSMLLAAATALAVSLSACCSSTQTSSTPPTAAVSQTRPPPPPRREWAPSSSGPRRSTRPTSRPGPIAASRRSPRSRGRSHFNLGFLQAESPGSCTLTWDGSQSADSPAYKSEIGQLKQRGGDVALAFGGQSAGNNGTEIADSAPTSTRSRPTMRR